jgi:hypothetical protein
MPFIRTSIQLRERCTINTPSIHNHFFPRAYTHDPTSCEEVEGICLELTFNVESCSYEGPMDLKPGPVTLIFHNEGDDWVGPAMVRVVEDKTLEDLLHYFSEEPKLGHAPSWLFSIPGSYKDINAGESHFWEGDLEPGIFALLCVHTPLPWPEPPIVWLGKIWTIED